MGESGYVLGLAESMPKRCRDVTEAGGGPTNY